MALQCDICCDKFTTKKRHPIKCDYEDCKAITCLQCFRRFLIMDGSEQECMSCKQPIPTEFIFIHTPKVFRDEYMKKVVKLDISKERALLKATQERMDARARSKLLTSRLTALNSHLKRCSQDEEMVKFRDASEEELRKLYKDVLEKSDEEINSDSTSFFCPLVMCTGIVKNGRCNDCKKTVCAKCREERNEGHECKKEQLETIKLLKRDTKPCPRCKVPIHKIDGCDQMFCTKCKTAFSWRTLTIHKGVMHNPHYHEYMAQLNNGNVPIAANDPCGEELNRALKDMDKSKAYQLATKRTAATRAMRSNSFIWRVLAEINAILPVLANDVYDDETLRQNKQQLRESYLIQRRPETLERAEANWVIQLRLNYKRREMKKDLIKLIEVFERGLKDFIIIGHAAQDYDTMFENINILIEYIRTQLIENEKRHNLKNRTGITLEHGLQCRLIAY